MLSSHNNSHTQELETNTTKLWIVLVGVNVYQDLDISDLQYCANDCLELAEALQIATQGFQETEILALYDGEEKVPEKGEVITSIQQFRLAQSSDTILFYFSGHSYLDSKNRPVLCVADTQLQDLAATTLPIDILLNEFRQSPAQNQLIWLDACQEEVTDKLLSIFDQQAEQSQQGQNFYAVLSCDRTERSWEFSELKHGLFTYYLIEGLKGNAADNQGRIETENLFRYVKNQIGKFIQQRKNCEISSSKINIVSRGLVVNPDRSRKSKIKSLPKDVSQTPQRIAKGGGELFIGLATPPTQRRALIIDSLLASKADIDLCKLLQSKGGFTVDYCFVSEKHNLDIKSVIFSYLESEDNQTVLLYLAGKIQAENQEQLELVTATNTRINLNLLGQQIQSSPVKEIILILDNLGRQETNRLKKTLLPSIEKSFCLITASAIDSQKRSFLQQLAKILANTETTDFWVSELITELQRWNNSQAEITLDYCLSGSTAFREILLPFVLRSNNEIFEIDVCPYKSLESFTQDDAYFFHGRDEKIKEVINKLQNTSFIAVVGASGSGKSSLVRAGVIPKLINEGLLSSDGKEYLSCKTWVIRPSDWILLSSNNQGEKENLISALAASLKPNNKEVTEGILHLGIDSFVQWLRQQPQSISVLVIDQFEELFTLTAETDKNNFLDLILGVTTKAEDCFKVVITLRDDFLKNCLAHPQLAHLVTQSTILVPSCLTEAEYSQIIKQPAQKVGLNIEEGLVNILLQELKTESLPLLQFALENLWKIHTSGKFTLKDYQENIGGLKKILGKKAQETYENLNPQQQECAQFIFLELVQLGEGKGDTCRRLPKSRLLVDKYKDVFEHTLESLIKARLLVVSRENKLAHNSEISRDLQGRKKIEKEYFAIIKGNDIKTEELELSEETTSEQKNQNKDKVTVEVAHEILIRDWDTLRWWLDQNRNKLRLMRELEQEANQWESAHSSQKDGFLLSETRLAKYEELYINYHDELKVEVEQFVRLSIEKQNRLKKEEKERTERKLEQEKKATKNLRRFVVTLVCGLLISSSLTYIAIGQWKQAYIKEIKALTRSAEAYLDLNQEFDSLMDSLRASREMENFWLRKIFGVDDETRIQLTDRLQQSINFVRERNRLEGHKNQVWSVSFSPDNELIATASYDNTVRIWNTKGELISTLKDPNIDDKDQTYTVGVKSVSFSSDGQLIVTGSNDTSIEEATVKLWNREGELIQRFPIRNEEREDVVDGVSSISFSPDDNLIIAVTYSGKAILWKQNGQLYQTLKDPKIGDKAHQMEVKSVSFSSDGQLIATGSDDGTVKLWGKNQNDKYELIQPPLKGHKGEIWNVKFSPDDNFLATASNDRTVKLWKRQNGQYKEFSNLVENNGEVLSHNEGILSISFSPDGQTLATASDDKTVKLWKKQNGEYKYLSTLNGHKGGVLSVSFSPDGQTLATASDDRTVKLWNLNSQRTTHIDTNKDIIWNVSYSPDGKILASGGQDSIAKLWNEEDRLIHTIPKNENGVQIHNDGVWIYFSPDNKLFATTTWERQNTGEEEKYPIHLWKIANFKRIQTITEKHTAPIADIDFSSDSQLMISSDWSGVVNLWRKNEDSSGYTFKYSLKDPTNDKAEAGGILGVSFSPDNRLIATGSVNGTVKLWDSKKGQPPKTLKDSRIQDEDKKSCDEKAHKDCVEDEKAHKDGVKSVSFSSDSKLIATASWDETVKLWRRKNNKNEYEYLQTLIGHEDDVWDVKFSPDDSFLATASKDSTIKIWKKNQGGKYEYFRTLYGHNNGVTSISFSPDGTLASASIDRRVILWNSYQKELDELLGDACNWVSDYLTNNSSVREDERQIHNFCKKYGSHR